MKQVNSSHYSFKKYMDKKRWVSVWHQLDEVLKLQPDAVLEIGPGPGFFKLLSNHLGISVQTLDIDPDLKPDYIASVFDLPFKDNCFDCVCAFQMLEHLPYDKSLIAFKEMVRVAKNYVIISLPDAKVIWPYSFHIPKIGLINIKVPKPFIKLAIHNFDGEHYWEINKYNYSLKVIINDFGLNSVELVKTYRVPENTYHRFFIFKKQ